MTLQQTHMSRHFDPALKGVESDIRFRIRRAVNLVARQEREAQQHSLTWQPFANLQVTPNQQKP